MGLWLRLQALRPRTGTAVLGHCQENGKPLGQGTGKLHLRERWVLITKVKNADTPRTNFLTSGGTSVQLTNGMKENRAKATGTRTTLQSAPWPHPNTEALDADLT